MLVVETVAKVRRAYFVQGKAIKQICRELKLSRKVVRKVLRSDETSFEYKREPCSPSRSSGLGGMSSIGSWPRTPREAAGSG